MSSAANPAPSCTVNIMLPPCIEKHITTRFFFALMTNVRVGVIPVCPKEILVEKNWSFSDFLPFFYSTFLPALSPSQGKQTAGGSEFWLHTSEELAKLQPSQSLLFSFLTWTLHADHCVLSLYLQNHLVSFDLFWSLEELNQAYRWYQSDRKCCYMSLQSAWYWNSYL